MVDQNNLNGYFARVASSNGGDLLNGATSGGANGTAANASVSIQNNSQYNNYQQPINQGTMPDQAEATFQESIATLNKLKQSLQSGLPATSYAGQATPQQSQMQQTQPQQMHPHQTQVQQPIAQQTQFANPAITQPSYTQPTLPPAQQLQQVSANYGAPQPRPTSALANSMNGYSANTANSPSPASYQSNNQPNSQAYATQAAPQMSQPLMQQSLAQSAPQSAQQSQSAVQSQLAMQSMPQVTPQSSLQTPPQQVQQPATNFPPPSQLGATLQNAQPQIMQPQQPVQAPQGQQPQQPQQMMQPAQAPQSIQFPGSSSVNAAMQNNAQIQPQLPHTQSQGLVQSGVTTNSGTMPANFQSPPPPTAPQPSMQHQGSVNALSQQGEMNANISASINADNATERLNVGDLRQGDTVVRPQNSPTQNNASKNATAEDLLFSGSDKAEAGNEYKHSKGTFGLTIFKRVMIIALVILGALVLGFMIITVLPNFIPSFTRPPFWFSVQKIFPFLS